MGHLASQPAVLLHRRTSLHSSLFSTAETVPSRLVSSFSPPDRTPAHRQARSRAATLHRDGADRRGWSNGEFRTQSLRLLLRLPALLNGMSDGERKEEEVRDCPRIHFTQRSLRPRSPSSMFLWDWPSILNLTLLFFSSECMLSLSSDMLPYAWFFFFVIFCFVTETA